jgi:hypothetical protein
MSRRQLCAREHDVQVHVIGSVGECFAEQALCAIRIVGGETRFRLGDQLLRRTLFAAGSECENGKRGPAGERLP